MSSETFAPLREAVSKHLARACAIIAGAPVEDGWMEVLKINADDVSIIDLYG